MSPDPVDDDQSSPPAACPICGKPAVQTYRPFCSKRCANVDLQRWLTGRYAIAVVEDEDGPEDSSEDDGAGQGGRGSL